MNFLKDVPARISENVTCVVEIPRGSNAKYEYNSQFNFFELDRCLVSAMNYPANYGFIPQTVAEDGDPLDCIVLTDVPLHVGVVVQGKPIAILEMFDKGVRDDKVLIIPKFNNRYRHFSEIKEEYLEVYKDFFQNYKNLTSKSVKVIGWKDDLEAEAVISNAIKRFNDI